MSVADRPGRSAVHHAGTTARTTAFTPRINALLREHVGDEVFRLDAGTVGVAGPGLMDAVLRARPATEHERPTFKPLRGRSIGKPEAAAVMRAVSADVKAALKKPVDPPDAPPVDLSGQWPPVGHRYLRDIVFGADPYRLKVLVDRRLELTTKLTWTVIGAGAVRRGPSPDSNRTNLSIFDSAAHTYAERRHALGLYRRAAAPVCFTVSTLVANALWLGAPFADDMPADNILHEAMRLLPPSWNILRLAGPEFPRLDPRIGPADDVLLLPLLSHRDPALWEAPDEFRPERWNDLDPDDHPGYLPFGHSDERCWGRHMVMPLARRLLGMLRTRGLVVSPAQREARVPLAGLLGVQRIRIEAAAPAGRTPR